MRVVKSVGVAISPRYVLRIDDLPKNVEADGVVWPCYLPLKDCGRLFGVDADTIRKWALKHDFPLLKIGRNVYAQVGAIADWIDANTVTEQEMQRFRLRERAERYHLCAKCTEEYMARRHKNRGCQCECHRRGEEEVAVPFAETTNARRFVRKAKREDVDERVPGEFWTE